MFLFLDRPKNYFSEELEIFSNIKVEAKFSTSEKQSPNHQIKRVIFQTFGKSSNQLFADTL